MGKHRVSEAEAHERRRRERDPGGDALVDLRMVFALDGEIVLDVGGIWDRRLEDFDGEATTGVAIQIHPGQLRAVQWFGQWLEAHRDRRVSPPPFTLAELDSMEIDLEPTHVYSALFAGGRRGGKTWIAVALAVAYAVAFPNAIVWVVSPSDKKHDEVRRYASGSIAAHWLERETAQGWELCNGSVILLKSGYEEEGLKEGEANLVVINEGQRMSKRVYTLARGGIVDKSGLVLVCANPPTETKDQPWVSDFAAEAAAGKRASVFLEFNPLENPHIDRRGLLAMKAELDERTFAIEVLGQFRGAKDAVAWNWLRLENELTTPFDSDGDLVDVTGEFLRGIDEGEGISEVAGLDVQRFPYIGGPIYRFYASPKVKPDRDNVIAWVIDEIVLEGGDEVDWCDKLEVHGYDRASLLIVCDASGQYQHSRRRSVDSPPPEWKGRGSFSIIRGEGWRRIVPPSRTMKRNPELVDRARAFTSMICSGTLVRRLFADPDRAPLTCQAIREWKTVNGKPSRSQQVAHLGDGASYPIVRLFPRILRSGKPGGVDPVAAKVDRPSSRDGATRVLGSPRRGSRTRGI